MDKLDIMRTIKERGLMAKDIAQKMGVSHIALSNRINGNPRLDTLHNIAEAIGCNIRDFFYTEEDAPEKNSFVRKHTVLDFTKEQDTPDKPSLNTLNNNNETSSAAPFIHTALCPHCGAKVRVGVVLFPE